LIFKIYLILWFLFKATIDISRKYAIPISSFSLLHLYFIYNFYFGKMSDLKRRPLHHDTPRTLSQSRDEVDQNNTLILESANSYEEGTSSAGEQEESESQEQEEASEDENLPRRHSIPTPTPSSKQEHHHSINEQQGMNRLSIKLALAGALFGLFFVYVWGGSSVIGEKQCAFKSLRGNHPQQPEIVWKALQKGVEGLINKKAKHPSVFLFLHQNPKLQKLIDAIAVEASACYGKKV